mmetsp:Transcript_14531/g.61233  ORF Transcript_14531/g.61233 Transcript_14531/m.61233 type:complete len:210 (-) Transcript_14531:63-692(-)
MYDTESSSPFSTSRSASTLTMVRPFQELYLVVAFGVHEWFTRHSSGNSPVPANIGNRRRETSYRSSASLVSSTRISSANDEVSSASSKTSSSSPPHLGLPAARSSSSLRSCASSARGRSASSVAHVASAPSFSSTLNNSRVTFRIGPSTRRLHWFRSQIPSTWPNPSFPSRSSTSGTNASVPEEARAAARWHEESEKEEQGEESSKAFV